MMLIHFTFGLLLMVPASPAVSAPPTKSTIRQIDFRNFTYAWDDSQNFWSDSARWLDSPAESQVEVIDGLHLFEGDGDESEIDPERHPALSVERITYGDLIGDGQEEAIVSLNYGTGGTANWDYVYVYRMKQGHPMLLERMRCGSRGSGGLLKVSVKNTLLIADFADGQKLQGDCCSSGYVRVRYRWSRGAFIEVGTREYGDMKLREGPKGVYRWEEADKE